MLAGRVSGQDTSKTCRWQTTVATIVVAVTMSGLTTTNTQMVNNKDQHIHQLTVLSTEERSIALNLWRSEISHFDLAKRNTQMVAINFADQSRLYQHDYVFLRMPLEFLQVDPKFITEHTGLKVPTEYDCAPAFERSAYHIDNDPLWVVPLMAKTLSIDYKSIESLSYDYYRSVPSRWHDCNNLQSFIVSGQKWFLPSYPIVDEEYIELTSVYQMAMRANETFTLVEIGARWGTWGFRAAAAIRRYNPTVQKVNLFFVEPDERSCAALDTMAEVNNFKPPKFDITVVCDYFAPPFEEGHIDSLSSFRAWAAEQKEIDVFDMDCQGCEYQMIPMVMDILNAKVRRVIIGLHTHKMEGVTPLLNAFEGWVRVHVTGVFGLGDSECIKILRSGMKWEAQTRLQFESSCSKAARFDQGYGYGPMINWDGDMILDNPKFHGQNDVV